MRHPSHNGEQDRPDRTAEQPAHQNPQNTKQTGNRNKFTFNKSVPTEFLNDNAGYLIVLRGGMVFMCLVAGSLKILRLEPVAKYKVKGRAERFPD